MKVIITVFFLSVFVMNASAYLKDYSKIDAYAKATPKTKEVTVGTLAHYLVVPAKGDSEKVRSIFIWITSHISYDWDAYENNAAQWQEPMVTLKRHKGVCQNYSDLFTALCVAAGMQAQTITGYSKNGLDNDWILAGFGSSNHAWNVVKVHGRWELMDVTWAENSGNMSYFMAVPLIFRRNHLPLDVQWQLTKDTMTLEEYEQMPVLEEGFDKYHVTHLTPAISSIKGKKKIVFSFDSDHNLHIIAKVSNYDHTDHSLPKFIPVITHTGNHYTLTLTFATEGTYLVSIADDNFLGDIASYVVDTHANGN